MPSTTPSKDRKTAAYWRTKFEKQSLLLQSITSLLNKYGNCLDLNSLHREFLLSLMGQYAVGDSCYFTADHSYELSPTVAYGRIRLGDLHNIELSREFLKWLDAEKRVHSIEGLPNTGIYEAMLRGIRDTMEVVGPLYVNDRLIGIVFLGKKLSGKPFDEFDFEFLNALCATSAVAFNNAKLYENIKSSSSEVQRLTDLRNEMIGRISHEFRTPLTGIRGGVDCLLSMEEPHPIIEVIAKSADRLQELIDSLLVLNDDSRAGKYASRETFDPTDVINELFSRCATDLSKKGLSYEVHGLPHGVRPPLTITCEGFERVVTELLKNAIHFSRENTAIRVEMEVTDRQPESDRDGIAIVEWARQGEETIDAYEDLIGPSIDPDVAIRRAQVAASPSKTQRYLVVRVIDEGIGIPPSELPFIGEPFRQASNSPDKDIKGSALGLAVVRKVLAASYGQLYCDSKENVGATFSVFLPVV